MHEDTNLQDEDEIIHRLVPMEEVVLHRPLVLLIIFQLLDDVGMLQQTQQNLFRHLHGCEWFDLYREGKAGC